MPSLFLKQNEEWKPNTTFFDEQARRENGLLVMDVPDVPFPSDEELSSQHAFVKQVRRGARMKLDCSSHALLVRDGDRFTRPHSFETISPGLKGSWAIVIAKSDFRSNEGWVSSDQTGAGIVRGLCTCGLMPENIDKVICVSYIYDIKTFGKMTPEKVRVPVLYSCDERYPALFPKSCLEINLSRRADSSEPLHAAPGFARFLVQPAPEAQERINLAYAGSWKERLCGSLDRLFEDIIPKRLTKATLSRSQEDIEKLMCALCCGDGRTPDVFGHAFFGEERYAGGIPMVDGGVVNEFPMSGKAAQEMVETSLRDLDVMAEVVGIWEHIMEDYDVRFDEMGVGEAVDGRVEKMGQLAEVMGIDQAVHAYFSGVPVEYL